MGVAQNMVVDQTHDFPEMFWITERQYSHQGVERFNSSGIRVFEWFQSMFGVGG
jgi:hypothetical protein